MGAETNTRVSVPAFCSSCLLPVPALVQSPTALSRRSASVRTSRARWTAVAPQPPPSSRVARPRTESASPGSVPHPPPSEEEAALRARLAQLRRARRLGLSVAGGMLALSGGFLTVRYGGALPLPESAVAAAVSASVMLSRFEVEVGRDSVVYLSRRPPLLKGTGEVRDLVHVRETGDGRGRGAFAVTALEKGLRLGVYEGELIDNARFLTRYPVEDDMRSDYGIAVDSQWICDGRDAAARDCFTPAHMNHSSDPAKINVGRLYHRRQREVSFFTTRDIAPGEELVFNYGRQYWRGREELEI